MFENVKTANPSTIYINILLHYIWILNTGLFSDITKMLTFIVEPLFKMAQEPFPLFLLFLIYLGFIVSLFGDFTYRSRIFHLVGDAPFPVKGSKFWPMFGTYAIEQWGSLACQTNCDIGDSFIMVIFEDPWHSHLMLNVLQWRCQYLFKEFMSVEVWIRTPNLPQAGRTL